MNIKQGYKQTEIGIIPDDWEVKELNNVVNITRLAGYEYSTVWEESENGEIIALRGFNIGQNKIIEKDFVRISNKLSMKLIRSRLFKGDIVYPCVGTIGNAVVIEEDDKYHIQQNIAKITPLKNILNSYFVAYYLMSTFGFKEIEKFNGSSSQPNILVGSLRKYLIILPPLKEQTAIATALSDIDALIGELDKLIANKPPCNSF
jgi:type I restriction enzyme S subunit